MTCRILPNLPLPKGKEGRPAWAKPRFAARRQGGDFLIHAYSMVRPLIGALREGDF